MPAEDSGKGLNAVIAAAATRISNFVADNFIVIFGLLLIAGILISASYWSWDFWGEATFKDGKLVELKVDRGRIIQQSIILVGGVVALFLAMWRTWTAKRQADTALRQVELAQRGQNTERYAKAVEMLGDDGMTARCAGVFVLKEFAASEFPTSYVLAMENLRAFLRDRSQKNRRDIGEELDDTQFSDIQEAFSALGEIKALHDLMRPPTYKGDEVL